MHTKRVKPPLDCRTRRREYRELGETEKGKPLLGSRRFVFF
jgi:hypothetical protein